MVVLQLQADGAEMPRLAEGVAAEAAGLGNKGRQLNAIKLCLEDGVANLVRHGKPSGCGPIAITIHLATEPLRLTMEEDAIPFDPTALAARAQPKILEEGAPGGLGLALVQQFSAWRDYGREAGRNRLVIGFAGAAACRLTGPAKRRVQIGVSSTFSARSLHSGHFLRTTGLFGA